VYTLLYTQVVYPALFHPGGISRLSHRVVYTQSNLTGWYIPSLTSPGGYNPLYLTGWV